MATLVGSTRMIVTMRRAPTPGEVGHVGTCPLCSYVPGAPPCLACRDEMRARLAELQLATYVERAVN